MCDDGVLHFPISCLFLVGTWPSQGLFNLGTRSKNVLGYLLDRLASQSIDREYHQDEDRCASRHNLCYRCARGA
jgi:hypothetical protein